MARKTREPEDLQDDPDFEPVFDPEDGVSVCGYVRLRPFHAGGAYAGGWDSFIGAFGRPGKTYRTKGEAIEGVLAPLRNARLAAEYRRSVRPGEW